MKTRCLVHTAASLFLLAWGTAHAQTAGAEDRDGLRCISGKPFPAPEGCKVMAGSDFETEGKLPPGWGQGYGEWVVAADAPQGKAYFRLKAKKGASLCSPVVTVQPGEPCFLSYWIQTASDPWTTLSFTSDEREPSFTDIHTPIFYPNFPLDTGKQWRQGRVEKQGQPVEYGVASGDAFVFDVYRSAVGELSFKADTPAALAEPIVRDLPNRQHTVELITTGTGEVMIEGLYVFEPPEKEAVRVSDNKQKD